MSLTIDPEVGEALARMTAGRAPVARPAVGDWLTRRKAGNAAFGAWARLQPVPTDVDTRDFSARSYDGNEVLIRWFQKRGSQPRSAALYVHGGGMILGSVDVYDEILRRYVSASAVSERAVPIEGRRGRVRRHVGIGGLCGEREWPTASMPPPLLMGVRTVSIPSKSRPVAVLLGMKRGKRGRAGAA